MQSFGKQTLVGLHLSSQVLLLGLSISSVMRS